MVAATVALILISVWWMLAVLVRRPGGRRQAIPGRRYCTGHLKSASAPEVPFPLKKKAEAEMCAYLVKGKVKVDASVVVHPVGGRLQATPCWCGCSVRPRLATAGAGSGVAPLLETRRG